MYKISVIILFLIIFPYCSYANNACAQSLSFINIPKSKKEETAKKAGYTEPGFYNGLDAVHHITELGKYLRNHFIDPKTTHIQNLIFFINPHLRHIQKGLIASRQPHKLSELYTLKKETLDRMINHQVTLYWWQLFNIRLAALASSKIPEDLSFLNKYKTHDKLADYIENTKDTNEDLDLIKKALNAFPKKLILPTVSSLGILALNQPTKTNSQIVPAELSRQEKHVDGASSMTPLENIVHEFDHIINSKYGTPLFPENPTINKKIVSQMEQLPKEDRKKAEVIYWTLTHELLPEERPTRDQIINHRELMEVIRFSSIENPLAIFAETKLLNTLNIHNKDVYHSTNATDVEIDALFKKYELLLEESVRIFTRMVRTALNTHL